MEFVTIAFIFPGAKKQQTKRIYYVTRNMGKYKAIETDFGALTFTWQFLIGGQTTNSGKESFSFFFQKTNKYRKLKLCLRIRIKIMHDEVIENNPFLLF